MKEVVCFFSFELHLQNCPEWYLGLLVSRKFVAVLTVLILSANSIHAK